MEMLPHAHEEGKQCSWGRQSYLFNRSNTHNTSLTLRINYLTLFLNKRYRIKWSYFMCMAHVLLITVPFTKSVEQKELNKD